MSDRDILVGMFRDLGARLPGGAAAEFESFLNAMVERVDSAGPLFPARPRVHRGQPPRLPRITIPKGRGRVRK